MCGWTTLQYIQYASIISTNQRNKGTKTKTKKEPRTKIQQRQNQRAHKTPKNKNTKNAKTQKHKKQESLVLLWGGCCVLPPHNRTKLSCFLCFCIFLCSCFLGFVRSLILPLLHFCSWFLLGLCFSFFISSACRY